MTIAELISELEEVRKIVGDSADVVTKIIFRGQDATPQLCVMTEDGPRVIVDAREIQ